MRIIKTRKGKWWCLFNGSYLETQKGIEIDYLVFSVTIPRHMIEKDIKLNIPRIAWAIAMLILIGYILNITS